MSNLRGRNKGNQKLIPVETWLKIVKSLGIRGTMLGGLSAGVTAQSPSKRSRSPGVVALSPAKHLIQQGQIKSFF